MEEKHSEDMSIYKKCLENFPMPILIVGADERIIFMNESYGEFLGVTPKMAEGKHVLEIIKNSRTPLVLKTQKAEYADRHQYVDGKLKGREVIVHRIPIIENGKSIAVFGLLMFTSMEDLSALAEKNEKINNELRFYKEHLLELQKSKYSLDNIIGNSKVMHKLKMDIVKVAAVKQTVLITGESGVGKELIAHSIHNCSDRHERMFVRVNCAAIPDNLFESEFFGYEAGSFSGASKKGKVGRFELADGGTLFLDEIGEMPLFMQSKLLRVLQEKEITRVGGNKTIPVDVRIIAATNRNLERMVQAGEFREDLYYRINIINIYAPALREHIEDLPDLCTNILNNLYQENGMDKIIEKETIDVLSHYTWPGNVRELTNILSKMYFIAVGKRITVDDIPLSIRIPDIINKKASAEKMDTVLAEMEERMVSEILEQTGHNISKTAEILGISRPRLYRIMERLSC